MPYIQALTPPYSSWSDVQSTYTESENNLDSYFTPYTHFSEKYYNSKTFDDTYTYQFSYASSFVHPTTGDLYFAFEDWPIKKPSSTDKDVNGETHDYTYTKWTWGESGNGDYSSDRDLNDLIFRVMSASITGDLGTIVPKETALSWIWAAEDLGATDDFDFNDMVMEITTITTNKATEIVNGTETEIEIPLSKRVTFKALAAGGTLPIYIHWNDYTLGTGIYYESGLDATELGSNVKAISEMTAMEWHQWFGVSDYSRMLNTLTTNASQYIGKECTIYMNASSFTVAGFGSANESNTIDGVGESGLYITVNDDRANSDATTDISDWDKDNDSWTVSVQGQGKASQMFMIDDATGTWAWPLERKHIMDAYPGFKDWVTDHTTQWYKSPNTTDTYTVTRN